MEPIIADGLPSTTTASTADKAYIVSRPPLERTPGHNHRSTIVRSDLASCQDSCKELQAAIGSLESALISFTGSDVVQGQVFSETRTRLQGELAAASKQQ